jgi:hypothetical protein
MENRRSIGSDNIASGLRTRFELVDFLFRFGGEHVLGNQELRDDYFRLCQAFEVTTDRMALAGLLEFSQVAGVSVFRKCNYTFWAGCFLARKLNSACASTFRTAKSVVERLFGFFAFR